MKGRRWTRLPNRWVLWGVAQTSLIPCVLSPAALTQVSQDLLSGVMAWRSRHASPRMCSCAAQVQAVNRRAVLRPAGNRAKEKELFEIQVTVKDIAFGQAVGPLEVQWCDDLHRGDCVRNIGRELRNFL